MRQPAGDGTDLSRERERLMNEAGIATVETHFRRIQERPFTEDERSTTTILFGNLTPKHEAFVKAAFERSGFRMQNLPQPTKQAFRLGKEYSNNGLCNPVYYTAGTLIQYLQDLEAKGLTRPQIREKYAYLTASDCGPCRFGLYESEYRQALHNAGFEGFRVLTTQLNKTSQTGGKQPGLEFSLDMTFNLVNALILGDLLYEITYQIRPYEVNPGDTDRAMEECTERLSEFLRRRRYFELEERAPRIAHGLLSRRAGVEKWLTWLGKFREHFYSKEYQAILESCGERLDQVELDRTRPKPIVKIVGEFYSHLSESEANYNMFSFLESEGAEVAPGSIGNILQYWFYKSRLTHTQRKGLDDRYPDVRWWQFRRRVANRKAFLKKPLILSLVDWLSTRQYARVNKALGGIAHSLVAQEDLARLASPYYNPLTRGGEGHLEVAKSLHYTKNHLCHMVLSLKPFGCMPSTQSDGVMASVSSHNDDMLFASIETSGDGDINAFSRVQMALSDARRKAKTEFQQALDSTGKRLQDIRAYIAARPELRLPSFSFPHRPGIAGVAANYILHVSDIMDRDGNGKGGRRG